MQRQKNLWFGSMKYLFIVMPILYSMAAHGQENYVIHLNDKDYNVSLDSLYHFKIHGREVAFSVSLKDTLIYHDPFVSFNYPKGVKVSKVKAGDGVEEIAILKPEGSGYLIEEFSNINPTGLNEMMLTQATKESISYGYKPTRSDYSRKLTDGNEITINKDVLRYKDNTNIYEVASTGKKDVGVLIVTMQTDVKDYPQEKNMIELMWNSLRITLGNQ